MNPDFESVFARLRGILEKHSGALTVKSEGPDHYSLEAGVGPAVLRAWGGKARKPSIPVAWVQVGKAYVSYHLMGVYGNTRLLKGLSKELKARMQGKTCFNFKVVHEKLFKELDHLTAQSIAGFRKAGYISEQKSTS